MCVGFFLKSRLFLTESSSEPRLNQKGKQKNSDKQTAGVYLNEEKYTRSYTRSRTRSMTFIRRSFRAIAIKKKEEGNKGKEGGGVDFSARREPRLAFLSQSNTPARQQQ